MVHPDRVDENQKLIATEKFKVLCKVHSILQNSEKRKVYDDSGDVDDESDIDSSWINYWKTIFRVITLDDIKKYEQDYLGSETEVRDLKRAYINGKGSMDHIIQAVPFANCDHEDRYLEIIRKLVDEGEVEEYSTFFNEPEKKKVRRKKKEQKERAQAEAEISTGNLEHLKIDINYKINFLDDLEKELLENSQRREQGFFDLISKLENEYGPKKEKRKSITASKSSPAKKRRTPSRK